MNKLKLVKTGILLLTMLSATGAQAAVGGISLSDLINNGGSITVNDKIFDNWSFTLVDSSDPLISFSAANIDVTGLPTTGSSLLDPGPGLAFNILNGGTSVTGDGIYAFLDFTIGFTASVLAGSPYDIKDVSLDLTGGELSGTGNTDSGVFIQEDVYNAATKIATTDVGLDVLDGVTSSNLSNSVGFTPQKSINVTKNILLWATDAGDMATLTSFNQHFSQLSQAPEPTIPEPAILLLLSIGLMMAAGYTKKWQV